MIKKIMVAYDGSYEANQAMNIAVNTLMEKDRKKLNDIITQAVKKAEDQGIKVQSKVIEDKPGLARIGPNLVNFAELLDIDLIIMGRRSIGAINRLVLGSVSNYVIQAAKCAVMFVKE